jgi:hypothetical protein
MGARGQTAGISAAVVARGPDAELVEVPGALVEIAEVQGVAAGSLEGLAAGVLVACLGAVAF